MLLKKMVIQNFKGIKTLEIDFSEKSNLISGLNGTGKTSVYDAYCWCLFGKNSQESAKFDIRKYGIDDKAETFVEVVTDTAKYKRVFGKKTVRTTVEGVSKTVLENDYKTLVDDVELPATKYKKVIEELVGNSETFKILSNIFYLPAIMDWKKRREFLINTFGSVSDEQILQDKEFAELLEKIGGKNVEDAKAQILFEIKQNKEELEKIPVRIDEVEKSKNDISKNEVDQAEKEITKLKKEKSKLEKEIESFENKDIEAIKNKIAELRNQKEKAINDSEKLYNMQVEKEKERLFELKEKLSELNNKITDFKYQIETAKRKNADNKDQHERIKIKIAELDTEREDLRNQFKSVNDTAICSECNQKYPENKIAEIKKNIQKKGKKISAKIDKLNADMEKIVLEIDITDIEKNIETAEKERELLLKQIKEIEASVDNKKPVLDTAEYDTRISAEQEKIENINADNSEKISEIKNHISVIDEKISEQEKILFAFNENKKANDRIKEINVECDKLNEVSQKLALLKYQLDNFDKKKASLNEDIINKNFKNVKFKLFELQVNGGLNTICEATIDESPFNSNLNTGSKILAGLEIVEVLSEKLNAKFPVFIDNRESLTSEIETDLQVISLVASENDKSFKADNVIKL